MAPRMASAMACVDLSVCEGRQCVRDDTMRQKSVGGGGGTGQRAGKPCIVQHHACPCLEYAEGGLVS